MNVKNPKISEMFLSPLPRLGQLSTPHRETECMGSHPKHFGYALKTVFPIDSTQSTSTCKTPTWYQYRNVIFHFRETHIYTLTSPFKGSMPERVTFGKKKAFYFPLFKSMYLNEFLELRAHIWRATRYNSEKLKNGLNLWKSEIGQSGGGSPPPP